VPHCGVGSCKHGRSVDPTRALELIAFCAVRCFAAVGE
jgi:hypothetical protein